MSEKRPSLQRQIEDLQKELTSVRAVVGTMDSRMALLGRRPQVRFGLTMKEGLEPYPPETATAFAVRFKDVDFVEETGNQLLGGVYLDKDAQRIAMTVPPGFVEEGSSVVLIEWDGKHYIVNSQPTDTDDLKDCICTVVDILRKHLTLEPQDHVDLDNNCDCPSTINKQFAVCDTCADGKIGKYYDLDLEGVVAGPDAINVPPENVQWFNGRHRFTFHDPVPIVVDDSCSASVSLQTSGVYDSVIELRHMIYGDGSFGWEVTLKVIRRNILVPSNPTPIQTDIFTSDKTDDPGQGTGLKTLLKDCLEDKTFAPSEWSQVMVPLGLQVFDAQTASGSFRCV